MQKVDKRILRLPEHMHVKQLQHGLCEIQSHHIQHLSDLKTTTNYTCEKRQRGRVVNMQKLENGDVLEFA